MEVRFGLESIIEIDLIVGCQYSKLLADIKKDEEQVSTVLIGENPGPVSDS